MWQIIKALMIIITMRVIINVEKNYHNDNNDTTYNCTVIIETMKIVIMLIIKQ